MYRTENQIYRDLITIVNTWLQANNITGWKCKQSYQTSLQNCTNKTILISRVYSRRLGLQGNSDEWDVANNQMVHTEKYRQETMYQFSFFNQRGAEQTVNDLTSSDIGNKLLSFFQSTTGIKAFSMLSYSILKIRDLREPFFKDDSQIYERMPNFDLTIWINQEETSIINTIDKINSTIKEI